VAGIVRFLGTAHHAGRKVSQPSQARDLTSANRNRGVIGRVRFNQTSINSCRHGRWR